MDASFLTANVQTHLVYLATTSDVKFDQYREIFRNLGVELRRATVIESITEPQLDERGEQLLVGQPLRQAARFVEKNQQIPYMIEDTILVIDALSQENAGASGLPGADTKNWWRNLGAGGVLRLLAGVTNRRATFTCQLGIYLGKGKYRFARADLKGTISQSIRISARSEEEYPMSNPYYFHAIFEPNGSDKTLGELDGAAFAKVDYRRQCAAHMFDQLCDIDWLSHRQLDLPYLEPEA